MVTEYWQLSDLFEDEENIPDGFDLPRPESDAFSILELSKEFPIRLILKDRHTGESSSPCNDWTIWLINVLKGKLSEYPTSLEEDKVLLHQLVDSHLSKENHRKAMAIEVRIGEKEILTQVITKLEALDGEMSDTEPPKKKI